MVTKFGRKLVRGIVQTMRPAQIRIFCLAEDGQLYLAIVNKAVDTEQNRQFLLRPYFAKIPSTFSALGRQFDSETSDGRKIIFEWCFTGCFQVPQVPITDVTLIQLGTLSTPDFTPLHAKGLRHHQRAIEYVKARLPSMEIAAVSK